jgi:hypothetical protein
MSDPMDLNEGPTWDEAEQAVVTWAIAGPMRPPECAACMDGRLRRLNP